MYTKFHRWYVLPLVGLLFVSIAAAAPPGATAQEPGYDIILRGGRVFDGAGNPWVLADVAISDGRIAAVGRLGEVTAEREIDVDGLYVMPGIIDMHSHAKSGFDDEDPRARATINNLMQGITTVVIGENGSAWSNDRSIGDKAAEWSRNGIGTNAAMLVGIDSIRHQVIDGHDTTPTAEDLVEMGAIVREAMEGGAFGISSALDYWDGHFITTDEIIALAKEVAPFGGIYSSHIRSEGTRSLWWVESHASRRVTHLDAVKEIIEVGRAAEIPVHILHIKSTGIPFWGKSRAVTALIEKARADGIDVTADQYPYTFSNPDRTTELFKWEPYLGEAGRELERPQRMALIKDRMQDDPVFAAQVEKDVYHEILARGGADRMWVTRFEANPAYTGKTLEELAALRQESLFEVGKHLQLENAAKILSYTMIEDDIEHYLTRDYIAPATDGGVGAETHPRAFGTFPRVLRRYVIDKEVITLPFFVRKVTMLPASILGLDDRGMIKEGYRADIMVFNPGTIRDRATFEENIYSEGVEYLLVNGKLAIDDGQFTGALAGEVILRR
jgi:N-acyl-D-aspartate/D-glutamate deacylase